ncbi:hypothetical protein JXJ21_20995 [candidate division KSB1 bacterium]|nr:hypothetical protein [candidate division KSB1 bacterium]
MERAYTSSKIKNLAIELKDFHFFHSPYQLKYKDKRFIGRQEKIKQLKSVLTDTIPDSGTYLVTGYRGSGKTSFVNMVLVQIAPHWRFSDRVRILLRAFLIVMLTIPVFWLVFPMPWYVFLISMLLSWLTLLYFDPLKPTVIKRKKKGLRALKKELRWRRRWNWVKKGAKTLFYIERNVTWNDTPFNVLRVLYLVATSFTLLSLFSLLFEPVQRYADIIPYHLFACAGLFIYWFGLRLFDLLQEQHKSKRGLNFMSLLAKFMDIIKPIFKPRIVIRLNLNYESLNERNILQLIASTLYERYRKWRRTRLQLLLRLLKITFFWVLVCVPYQLYNIKGDDWYNHAVKRAKNQTLPANSVSSPKTGLLRSLKAALANQIANLFKSEDASEESAESPEVALHALIYRNINVIYRDIRHFLAQYYRRIPLTPAGYVQYVYPPDFEPLLMVLFSAALLIIYGVFHSGMLNLPGHTRVLRMLRELNERMAAAITVKSGTDFDVFKGFGKWIRRKDLTYPLADERTIEQEVIRILEEISSLPVIFGHPVILFVFDELDKITLRQVSMQTEQEEALYMSSFENIRHRQQQVERILSNLKQLLTTSFAKFIFIAGREMFDAGLADFTSRTFLHNSIFNQTFYINSFLTDHSNPKGKSLLSLTESYVCQFLIPPGYAKTQSWPRLEDYENYIRTNFKLTEQEANKALHVLNNFITYLTYRGNGSPKKITQLFEEYVESFPENMTNDEWLVIGENCNSKYLIFDYSRQFIIGSASRLLEPLHRTLERSSSRMINDKLVTSIFMVLDHLFKFHHSAFRRDFLEWMPEMLDIHRDPDLRNVIQEMLRLIERSYLKKVDNGLFDYRFSNRITGEIDFASRIRELESAVFNFTLDESLEAEEFFRRQLKDQLQLYDYAKNCDSKKAKSSCTISGLHEIIGDLHAFDEEYDQAITEYFNALDRLEAIN